MEHALATLGLSPADKEAVERFRRDVVEPSMTKLVIIDFWAEWCGPCKALTPVLEKVAAAYADKGVVLAKIDVDAEKFIAAQFQVRSIPTVYAMFQGQLAADLTQYRSEGQLKQVLDQLLRQLPITPDEAAANLEAEVEPLVAMGEEVLASGDAERALAIFDQIVEMAPEHAGAVAGRARALLALDRADEAAAMLAGLPEALGKQSEIARVAAAIDLARTAVPAGEIEALSAAVDANPEDHDARLALANAQIAAGQRDAAADTLLAMIAADRDWNEGAARQQLLKLFEAVGIEDPWVSSQRRRLSAVLFG
jgi:putative thioredoxin